VVVLKVWVRSPVEEEARKLITGVEFMPSALEAVEDADAVARLLAPHVEAAESKAVVP
jgi:3-hydroxyisobutyrate dehydrogenase-like beta-hydroxyacid dehydrogenase